MEVDEPQTTFVFFPYLEKTDKNNIFEEMHVIPNTYNIYK